LSRRAGPRDEPGPAGPSAGRSHGVTRLKRPASCTETERREFARLVRRGFRGSDARLPARIEAAERLAFRRDAGGDLVAIAALKAPDEGRRAEMFRTSRARLDAADCELELGWVFVLPAHRGRGIAGDLCRRLLARVPTAPLFATTRPDNVPMLRILLALGFERVGRPFPHRRESLVLLSLVRA
jgi:RimJ/RimL family protein N-acetyltransferase